VQKDDNLQSNVGNIHFYLPYCNLKANSKQVIC
jgi:hypothetical protein